MAIRLRLLENEWIALCAVEADPKDGDIYLDDSQDHALRAKFIRDYELPFKDIRLNELMDSQKVRDAKEELLKRIKQNENKKKN